MRKTRYLKSLTMLLAVLLALTAATPGALADDPPTPVPAPVVTPGAVIRSDDDATGSVTFTSDQTGVYYHGVVAAGEAEPVLDTSGAGLPCEAGVAATLPLSELSQGAKDVYVVVKNPEGTCSAPTLIALPAAPTLHLSFAADALSCHPGGSITVQLKLRAKAHGKLGSLTGSFQFPLAFTASEPSAGTMSSVAGSCTVAYAPTEPLDLSTGDAVILSFKLTADAAAAAQSGALTALVASTEFHAPDDSVLDYVVEPLTLAVTIPTPPPVPAHPRWSDTMAGAGLWDTAGTQGYGVQLYKDGTSELHLVPAGSQSGFSEPAFDFFNAVSASGSGSYRFRARSGEGDWSELSPERKFYSVHLPTGSGFVVTPMAGYASPVQEGKDYRFTVTLDKGYFKEKKFAVKANGTVLTPDANDIYTLPAVAADQSISLEGIGTGTTIADLPAIATESLGGATMGKAYSVQLLLKQEQKVKWSVVGALPTGLTLSADGVLAGTPARRGSWSFTVQATNSIGTAKKQLSLTVNGSSYSFSGSAEEWTRGGEGSLTFTANTQSTLNALMLDGAEIPGDTAGLRFSGAAVTLEAAYLNTLGMGEHLVTLFYTDGSADGRFTVIQADATVAPAITRQPVDLDIRAGEELRFTIAAEGTLPLLCQWQVDRNDGNGFIRLQNASGSTYSYAGAAAGWDGYRFRCVVTNEAGEAVSETVTLHVSGGETAAPEKSGGHTGLYITIALLGLLGLGGLGWFWWKRFRGKTKETQEK